MYEFLSLKRMPTVINIFLILTCFSVSFPLVLHDVQVYISRFEIFIKSSAVPDTPLLFMLPSFILFSPFAM